MEKYKCLPNYEVLRPGITIKFDLDGFYETSKEDEIAFLDEQEPFIKKVQKKSKKD